MFTSFLINISKSCLRGALRAVIRKLNNAFKKKYRAVRTFIRRRFLIFAPKLFANDQITRIEIERLKDKLNAKLNSSSLLGVGAHTYETTYFKKCNLNFLLRNHNIKGEV